MAKKQKPFRPKARRPRGFEDKPAQTLRAEQALIAQAFSVYDARGFEPLQTPVFEYADALGKFLPDEDRPNAGVFAMQDDDEQWMAMRYDLTAPMARYVAENYDALAKPYRRYQAGFPTHKTAQSNVCKCYAPLISLTAWALTVLKHY